MRLLLAVLVAVPASAVLSPRASAQVVIDPIPVVYLPGGASVEECRRQWQTNAPVRAYTAPSFVSSAVRTVDANRRVDANDYTESITAVLQPGRVRARAPLSIQAVRLGAGTVETVDFGTGEEFEILGIEGEGIGYFSHRGAVYAGEIPGYSIRTGAANEVEVVRDAVRETWVFLISYGADRPASWLNVSQAGLVERPESCG
ncbi:MAG: hypothetical protein Rubg2KO_14250 [Rubricoccaceae bacterium]